MRIVESADVAACGDAYSSMASLKVQGPTDGRRDRGDSSRETMGNGGKRKRSEV